MVQEERCQVGGGGLERPTVLGEMLGRAGAEVASLMSLYHLPTMPSGTEYRANKLSFLGP